MRTWKLITAVLMAGAVAGATTACGNGSDAAASPAPTPTHASPAPKAEAGDAPPASAGSTASAPAAAATATKAVTHVSTVSKAKPSGSGDPRFGTQYAIFKSGKASTRQITYDLIEWFDGKQAVKACAEDGEKAAENDYCLGWYVRNTNKKLRTLTVDPDAPIRIGVGDTKSVDLKTFLSEVPPDSTIRFDVDAGRIMKLDFIYLP